MSPPTLPTLPPHPPVNVLYDLSKVTITHCHATIVQNQNYVDKLLVVADLGQKKVCVRPTRTPPTR